MIEFQLDTASGIATYLQLVQQVRQALQLGILEPGDQLPTAQQVVAKLAINPNTVLKAYRDLEREGFVRARPGLGTFIVGSLPRRDPIAQAGTPLMPRRPPILHPLPRPAGAARTDTSWWTREGVKRVGTRAASQRRGFQGWSDVPGPDGTELGGRALANRLFRSELSS